MTSPKENKSVGQKITSSRTSMVTSLLTIILFTLSAVEGLSVVPKLDLSGIEAEHHKQLTVPTLNPTEVKMVLKVNLVHSDPNEILICTPDGKCKLQPIKDDKKSEDEEQAGEEGGKESYKPVIVTDFDLDAEDNKTEDDDGKKTSTKVPVFVAHKGAAPDVPPRRRPWGQETGRLPVYFGLKLGPEFHQPDRVVLQPIEYAPQPDVPDHVELINPKNIPRDGVRMAIKPFGRRSGVYWTTPNVVAVNDKIDLSTDDEVKVLSKLGELLGD